MANRAKGEVSLEIDGQAYTLIMTTDAMAQLEALFSTPAREVTFQQILDRVNAGSVRHIRGFVWAALQRHHPALTVTAAGELIDAAGGLEGFGAQLLALAGTTTPAPEDLQALGVAPEARPHPAQGTKRQRGTGGRSTATPAASA